MEDIKIGDEVIRYLGNIPIPMKVTKVTENKIHCGAWKFDKKTGAEIDKDLGWGPQGTGSYLCKK